MFRSRERNVELLSPVDRILGEVTRFGYGADDYIWRTRTYLEWAKQCGLASQEVAHSCIDLAETLTPIYPLVEMRQAKTAAWESKRRAALNVERAPRVIEMELDPVYFEAILTGWKTFGGRAFKPDSDKDYPDIRTGDLVRFTLSTRHEEFARELAARNLQPDDVMWCTVKDMYFAPTVHGMYQMPQFDGDAFQPMIDAPSEAIQIQRAAVYHTFPGYHELIAEHGFLGIHLQNPHLA